MYFIVSANQNQALLTLVNKKTMGILISSTPSPDMANNGEDRMIKEAQLIIYVLVNMKSMGTYGKVMERWHAKDVTECKLWPNVYSFIIAEYKQMLRKSSSTIGQDV